MQAEEPLKKLIHVVQKWMEAYTSKLNIDDSLVEKAHLQSTNTSPKILKEFDPVSEEMGGFIQTWIEVGFFCGYLAGSQSGGYLTGSESTNLKDDWLAKEFARSLTMTTFDKLTEEPVSPLVMGIDVKLLRLLRHIHESSLYAGFLSGSSDTSAGDTFDPYDLDKIFS
jgi:hypothetical protein